LLRFVAEAFNKWRRRFLKDRCHGLADCVFVEAKLGSHILTRQAVRTSQNDAASLR
jgi:hypothetical protein